MWLFQTDSACSITKSEFQSAPRRGEAIGQFGVTVQTVQHPTRNLTVKIYIDRKSNEVEEESDGDASAASCSSHRVEV